MTREAHRAALRATARLALCATAFSLACTPKTTAPPENTPVAEPAATQEATPATTEATPATTEATPAEDPAAAAALGACRDLTGKAWDAEGKRIAAVGTDDELKACCQSIAAATDPLKTSEWAQRSECCAMLEWQGSAACTPWGPPVPPAMA